MQEIDCVNSNTSSQKGLYAIILIGSAAIGYMHAKGIMSYSSLEGYILLSALPLTEGVSEIELMKRQKELMVQLSAKYMDSGANQYLLEMKEGLEQKMSEFKVDVTKMQSMSMGEVTRNAFLIGGRRGLVLGSIINGVGYAVGYGLGKLV